MKLVELIKNYFQNEGTFHEISSYVGINGPEARTLYAEVKKMKVRGCDPAFVAKRIKELYES